MEEGLFETPTKTRSLEYICRAHPLTDSANRYDTLLYGRPETQEKTARAQLSFLRDMPDVMAWALIDKNYNFGRFLVERSRWATRDFGGISTARILRNWFYGEGCRKATRMARYSKRTTEGSVSA